MAKRPVLMVFDHFCCHILVIAFLALCLAFERVVLNGIWQQLFEVASLAGRSALSFLGMSLWLGHQATVTTLMFAEKVWISLWKFFLNYYLQVLCIMQHGLLSTVADNSSQQFEYLRNQNF